MNSQIDMRVPRRVRGFLVILFLIFGIDLNLLAAIPANDSFANRSAVNGSHVVFEGDLTGATMEPGEPSHPLIQWWTPQGTAARSIWWQWTAPAKGGLVVNARASTFYRKGIFIYRGETLASLTLVGSNFGDDNAQASVEAGVTYLIAIASAGDEGGVVVSLQHFAAAPNDDFANRIVLSGTQLSVPVNLFATSMEPNEPGDPAIMLPFGNGAWWEWTAPVEGILGAYTTGCGMEFFEGTSLTNLRPFVVGNVMRVAAGQKFFIRCSILPGGEGGLYNLHLLLDGARFVTPVGGNYDIEQTIPIEIAFAETDEAVTQVDFLAPVHCQSGSGAPLKTLTAPPWRIEWQPSTPLDYRAYVRIVYASGREQYLGSECFNVGITPPANDLRANAVTIPPEGGTSAVVRLSGATLEMGEAEQLWADLGGSTGSAWWKWTPAQSGPASILPPEKTVLRVFAGEGMEQVSVQLSAGVHRFMAASNQAYWIGLRPQFEHEVVPTSELKVSFGLPAAVPVNDLFADRLPLSGSGLVAADLKFATREGGEPGAGASLWWTWTAAESGFLELEASSFYERLFGTFSTPALVQVIPYRGTNLAGLTTVSFQLGTWPDQSLRLPVVAGEKIILRLSLNRFHPDARAFLRYRFIANPPNDLFANRTALDELPVVLRSRFPLAATVEPNEPRPFNALRSLWWSWTSPYSGEVGLAMHGIAADVRLAIFEGVDVSNLTRVHPVTNLAGLLLFTAEQGRTYQIQASGSTETEFILHLSAGEPNDDFADSIPLTSSNQFIAASNLGASNEAGEPRNSGSLWWHFTAPVPGSLTLKHYAWALLEPWLGESIDALERILANFLTENNWVTRKGLIDQGTTVRVSLDTRLIGGQPVPQSILMEHDFSSLHIASPSNRAEFAFDAPVNFSFSPIQAEYDGEIDLVLLRFRKQIVGGAWNQDGPPHGNPVLTAGPLFTHTITNWPPGTYEVTARALNSSNEIRESAPSIFIIGPTNDLFANRIAVSAGTHQVPIIAGSSLEPFETSISTNFSGSAWWEWKAPWTGLVHIQTPTGAAIYRGINSSALTLVATNDAGNFAFMATKDEVYQVALLRRVADPYTGPFIFKILPAPENDHFANRRRVTIYEGPPGRSENEHQYENAQYATLEPIELDHGLINAAGSIWWEFTVPEGGNFAAGHSGTEDAAEFYLYRGSELGQLVPIALSAIDEFGFYHGATLEAGTYQIAVVTRGDASNIGGRLYLSFRSAAANDHFASAATLSGASGSVDVPFWFGTVEPSEPDPFWFPATSQQPFTQTLWWKWTAPRSGYLDIVIPEHLNWAFQPQFKFDVFHGEALDTLQKIPVRYEWRERLNNQTICNFEVTQGAAYYFRAGLGNEFLQPGIFSGFQFVLSEHSVAHDTVQTALPLGETSHQISGNTAGAREGTQYYHWTAPQEGLVYFSSTSSNVQIYISRFDANSNLVANAIVPPTSALHARPGEVYRIAISAYTPRAFEFGINLVAGQPNDDYASRRILSGDSGSFFADALYSSGTFGPNGEATSERRLYYEWAAPYGGELRIESTDGTPAHVAVVEINSGMIPTRIIAGRSYYFIFAGLESRSYNFWLESGEWTPVVNRTEGGLSFSVQGPAGAIVRIDVSEDLVQWSELGLFESQTGLISLPEELALPGHRFYRLTPLW